MRTCKICGKTKDDADFYGKVYTCKRCVCERNSRIVRERNLTTEPDLEGEIWKPYVGDSRYLVSNIGRVRGLYGQLLIPKEHKQGYLRLRIGNKYCLIHRLVAETFIPNPENKATVNHINGVKSDNKVENLEWATQSENNKHANITGLRKLTKRQWESMTKGHKISKHQVNQIIDEYDKGKAQSELANIFHISRAQVCRIVNRKSRNSYFK